jgi:hypothetical protein
MRTWYRSTGVDGWCDVARTPSGLRFAYVVPHGVVVEDEFGSVVWENRTLPESWLLYLRLDDSGVVVVGQGHESGLAYFVSAEQFKTDGPAHGQDCVALRNGISYVMRPPNGSYYTRDTSDPVDIPCVPTSQGFADITQRDVVVFRDTYFSVVLNGRTLIRPGFPAGSFVVGQTHHTTIELLEHHAPRLTAFAHAGYEPRIVRDQLHWFGGMPSACVHHSALHSCCLTHSHLRVFTTPTIY